MPYKTEIQEAVDALHDLDHILDTCTGNTEAFRRIEQLALALGAKDDSGGKGGNIRLNVADAITRAYLKKPLVHLQKRDT